MAGYQEIDPQELQALLAQGEVQLVDVRNDAEVAQGVISGARHVPLSVLPAFQNEFSDELPLVFYCHSGIRSAHACSYMANLGYDKLYNLRGGIIAWGKAELPFVPHA
jgi:rhodanese-related sulfurtransferase